MVATEHSTSANHRRFWRDPTKRAGTRLTLLRMSGFNRQGQAHIVSTAIQSPRSCTGVEATPWFRTWFPIDPQPESISPTINISIVFICAFLVDHGRIIYHPPIKNDSGAILRAEDLLPLATKRQRPIAYLAWPWILSPARLPIPPRRPWESEATNPRAKLKRFRSVPASLREARQLILAQPLGVGAVLQR